MSDAVHITHYKVIWEARKEGGRIVLQDDEGAQHEIKVSKPAVTLAETEGVPSTWSALTVATRRRNS